MNKCHVPININSMNSGLCDSCCKAKMHLLPFSNDSYNFHAPLDMIYSDIWGPSPITSFNGFNYYISFIDAYTRYTSVFLLNSKSQAFQAFLQFQANIERHTGFKIKALQTDHGREYLSTSFTQYLASQGITHRFSCPYTHQQNGRAERKHRHITEIGLAMLAAASLPLLHWDDAFLSATYIINRLPSSNTKNLSPYELLHNHSPDYSFLKVFGCACYPCLKPYTSHKFDFKSDLSVFLGYAPNHKGYKCLTKSGKVVITRHVLFDEHKFPYTELFSNTNPPLVKNQFPHTVLTFPILTSSPSYTSNSISHDPSLSSSSNDGRVQIQNVPSSNNALPSNSSPAFVSDTTTSPQPPQCLI
ncbi:hypothetical protein Ahy_B06g085995 isoform A [Arachis hypogaea]|uniref:Integrase catalytic domain-containing protein n=1 Tax=Arachis hypogaea TaxID=3818 RepID=A0A444YWC8_ARAHY|nr:hypothetical protein Ahy_B06g085995 isoform A [Arachis hypogaea]